MNMMMFAMMAGSSNTNQKINMPDNKYRFNIPISNKGNLNIPLEEGKALFVLGANGVGKSTLMHRLFTQNSNHSKRILAHRQTWIQSNSIDITAAQKIQNLLNIKNSDQNVNSRFKDSYSNQKTSISIYDLVNSENIRNKNIADAVDAENEELVKIYAKTKAPLKLVNEILATSNIPISISIGENQALFASKNNGSLYSIEELSDGERNALLICADVLTAKQNQLIILDEPERHLHRSIISPLLTTLFQKRKDCVFVISTHDVFLPIDNVESSTLLIRTCVWSGKHISSWDADLISENDEIPLEIKEEILGSKRNILFVEGQMQSLDKQIYQLIFPDFTVISKGSCREVQKAVEGIRSTKNLHWINAFGLIDSDDRTQDEIQSLFGKGIVALDCYSVESLYYNLETLSKIAKRYADFTGIKEDELFKNATSKIIQNISSERDRLCSRLCEKQVRNYIMSLLPDHKDILEERETNLDLDVKIKEILEKEKGKFDYLVKSNNLDGLISRYPIRETKVIGGIVSGLNTKKDDYESAVRKLIIDDSTVKDFYRNVLLKKLTDLINSKAENNPKPLEILTPTNDSNY